MPLGGSRRTAAVQDPSACRSGEEGNGTTHWLLSLERSVFQIASGYEDQIDSNTLQADPLLNMVWVSAERGSELASQRTMRRLENAVDERAHADQEGGYYYGQHLYHPLVVFDGQTGKLITAILRAGNSHSSRAAVALLGRIGRRLRRAWPEAEIEVRADRGEPRLKDSAQVASHLKDRGRSLGH